MPNGANQHRSHPASVTCGTSNAKWPGRRDQAALPLTSDHECSGAAWTTAFRVTSTVLSHIVPPAAVPSPLRAGLSGSTVQNVIIGQLVLRKTMTGAGVRLRIQDR